MTLIKTTSQRQEFDPFLISNKNVFIYSSFHSSTIKLNPFQELLRRTFLGTDNAALQLIKYQPNNIISEKDLWLLQGSSTIEESFPWFVKDGKILDYNQSVELNNGVELANHYLKTKLGVSTSEISNLKIKFILGEFLKDSENTSIINFYNHLSRLSKEDDSFYKLKTAAKDLVSDPSSNGILDMTIRELYEYLRDLNFPLLKDISINVDLFKFIPTILVYRGLVGGYIKHAYPLEAINKLNEAERIKFMLERKHATLLWASFFAPIATVTILTFLSRANPLSLNFGGESLNSISRPTFLVGQGNTSSVEEIIGNNTEVKTEGGTPIQRAFIFLFLSQNFKTLKFQFQSMNKGQVLK
jgi:hypothetical protein